VFLLLHSHRTFLTDFGRTGGVELAMQMQSSKIHRLSTLASNIRQRPQYAVPLNASHKFAHIIDRGTNVVGQASMSDPS
jgi:hypothetical protein